jgi:hypothetical protein
MVKSSGGFDVVGSIKIEKAPKISLRVAKAYAKRFAREVSFEDDAERLLVFSNFLRRIRMRFDAETVPPEAVVVGYREYRKIY